MNIGEQIIAASANLTALADVNFESSPWATVIWRPGAAEQLEAVVEAHIEERVRVRLELDRRELQERFDAHLRKVFPKKPAPENHVD